MSRVPDYIESVKVARAAATEHHLQDDIPEADTSKYVPSHVKLFYKKIYDKADARDTLDFHSPVERLAAINKQARELEKFLMDSFQLLMSSISVVETQRAADQAKLSTEQATLSM
jgi:DUF438 domain-containing protein